MVKYRFITIFVFATLLFACKKKNAGSKKEIEKIVFATGGCYGHCPIQAIQIDSSLTIKYHGVKYTEKIGFYSGIISRNFWDTLNKKLENINYQQLDSTYQNSVDDLSTEIFIYYDNKFKHIYGQSASLPDSVMNVYLWMMSEIKQLKLQPIKDSLIFPTIIEKPIPVFKETIEFIPPAIDDN